MNELDEQRLKSLFDASSRTLAARGQERVQTALDIAKEKTQYFEKIALGSGATIAAIVAFVGNHTASLHPQWLLRSALVALVIVMFGAMYRNWRYPFYLMTARDLQYLMADRTKEQNKNNYVVSFPAMDLDTGLAIDQKAWTAEFEAQDLKYEKRIKELQCIENVIFQEVKRVEIVILVLAIASMLLLVALAWLNF